jgi:Glycosyltransferases involved in cell wall biogenesis
LRTSVVIPTYNEAQNITELLKRLKRNLTDYEVIVVDDGSPDGTAELAKSLNGLYGKIKVINRGRRLGLASAVLQGVESAQGDVIVVMDADLQHPPEIVPKLVEEVEKGADIAIASRYIKGGGIQGWSVTRLIISKVATMLARFFVPQTRKVKDPLSGFFAARKSVFKMRIAPKGFKLLLELLRESKDVKVKEVPYVFCERKAGKSKLNLKEIANYLSLLFFG